MLQHDVLYTKKSFAVHDDFLVYVIYTIKLT